MALTSRQRLTLIRYGVVILRVLTGALFVISGISKDIDLWGTVYKIEEYLDVWGITQPRTIVFMGALLLSISEALAGALLLLGCCRRWVPRFLTAMMAVMLPLTLYIYISNPVSDCGCFGDFIVLGNGATFWKNVAITAALIFLLRYNLRVAPLFTPYVQWIVVTLISAYLLIVGLYGYNIQPMVDFRSFPVGSSLLPGDDSGHAGDGAEVRFIYEKDGERREFTIDGLPDSTWTFIDQTADSGADGATELVAYDIDGDDATARAISAEGEEIILVIPQLSRAEVSWTYFLNELSNYMTSRGGSMVGLIAGDDASVEAWSDISMASYPIYTAEATTLKELARGNMALVYLRDGKVVWKQSMAMMDTTLTEAMIQDNGGPSLMRDRGNSFFKALGAALILSLMLLYLLDSTGRLLSWRLKMRQLRRHHTRQ